MLDGDLVEMRTSREIAEKIIANIDIYKNKTMEVTVKALGYELLDLDPIK